MNTRPNQLYSEDGEKFSMGLTLAAFIIFVISTQAPVSPYPIARHVDPHLRYA